MNRQKNVLVCVTPQETSKILVKAGKAMAQKNGAQLNIISVLPVDFNKNNANPQLLENLYQTANKEGGEMAVYYNDDPALTVAAHIAKSKPMTLVVGFPGENSNDFISLIHLLVPEIAISMVDSDGTIFNMLPFESNHRVPT